MLTVWDVTEYLTYLILKSKVYTAIIGTSDVSSLYTDTPQDEGIAACSSALAIHRLTLAFVGVISSSTHIFSLHCFCYTYCSRWLCCH